MTLELTLVARILMKKMTATVRFGILFTLQEVPKPLVTWTTTIPGNFKPFETNSLQILTIFTK